MFGIGWTEMLVIGVVALIVIGPKDLPMLMSRIGKFVGQIRRMGSEFQREINRSTGLDQITDLRKTITEPLKKTAAEIKSEFNRTSSSGKVEPTGIVKPDPGVDSVVADIHRRAGLPPPGSPEAKAAVAARKPAGTKPIESPAPLEAIAPAYKPKRKPRANAAKPAAVAVVADPPAQAEMSLAIADEPLKTGAVAADAPKAADVKRPPKPRTPKPKPEATDG